jgi:hypothetical protein
MSDNFFLTAEMRPMMNEELKIIHGELNAKFAQQAAQFLRGVPFQLC